MSLTQAPHDWSDVSGWDRYHEARACDGPFAIPTDIGAEGWRSVRFLGFVKDRGGRVWFPGCGTDPGPRFYAYAGCSVLATDFSPASIKVQEKFARMPPERMFVDWPSFVKRNAACNKPGAFEVAEHDFTATRPPAVVDVVINCVAFQGLPPVAMNAAARNFFNALRPGGAAMIDTINVQGKTLRNGIEDSLIEAGFYVPFSTAERWYREQLESTGIVYGMVLGRPHIPGRGQYPAKQFAEHAKRDQLILDSFRGEYEARLTAEKRSVEAILASPETITAHIIYTTG